jgi:hypothetical protein
MITALLTNIQYSDNNNSCRIQPGAKNCSYGIQFGDKGKLYRIQFCDITFYTIKLSVNKFHGAGLPQFFQVKVT